jgi:hypothetical protein
MQARLTATGDFVPAAGLAEELEIEHSAGAEKADARLRVGILLGTEGARFEVWGEGHQLGATDRYRTFLAFECESGGELAGTEAVVEAPAQFDELRAPLAELCWNLGDEADQAALCGFVSMTSIPSRNLAPAMSLGN